MSRRRLRRYGRTGGKAAVAVVLILLVAAGVGCYFLFKGSGKVTLPPSEGVGGAGNDALAEVSPKANMPGAGTPMENGGEALAAKAAAEGLPMTETGEIDWNARYQQLKTKYAREFQEPKIGMNTTIELSSGTQVKGRISDLTENKITVRVGNGKATYMRNQLSARSQVMIFREVYGAYVAKQAITREKAAADADAQE